MKLLVICYDGLDRLFWRNVVPDRFDGIFGNYESIYQETVLSWMSIYTGLTVKEHGFEKGWYAFLNRKTSGINHMPCVWQDINKAGLTTGLFNLPLTYPVFPVDGWIVGGFPSFPNLERRAYPYRINDYLEQHKHMLDLHSQHGQYPEDPKERGRVHLSSDDQDAFNNIVSLVENRVNVLDTIISNHPVDVCMLGYSWLDHAGHLGFNVNGLYSNGVVNGAIEPLIDICKPDKVMIVSDHGSYFYAHPIRQEDNTVIAQIGLNHSKDAVLYLMGHDIDNQLRHEWDIKQVILDMIQ